MSTLLDCLLEQSWDIKVPKYAGLANNIQEESGNQAFELARLHRGGSTFGAQAGQPTYKVDPSQHPGLIISLPRHATIDSPGLKGYLCSWNPVRCFKQGPQSWN